MHLMGDRQVPQSVLVGHRQARKPHMGTGRDEWFLGVGWTWGVKDKYENRTELLDICYMLSRNLEFCAGGILLHNCCLFDMDLLRRTVPGSSLSD